MTEAEFHDEKQQSFKEAIARTAGQAVRADHVIIDAIDIIDAIEEMSTAARRLLSQGIRIAVSVNAVDKSAADAITVRLTAGAINTELNQAGLPPATFLEEVAEFAEEYSAQVRRLTRRSKQRGSIDTELNQAGLHMERRTKQEIDALMMVAADFVENPAFALAVVQVLERSVAEVTRTRVLLLRGGVCALRVRWLLLALFRRPPAAAATQPVLTCGHVSWRRLSLRNTADERPQVYTLVRVGFHPQKRPAKERVR
jgi:hypothetical protein